MILSIGKDITNFIPKPAVNFEDLEDLIQSNTYSLNIYKNNYRKSENFNYTDMIALDFDGGYSIEQAKKDFKDYKCIIAPTRNHNKLKNGVKEDRFRVILFLSETIKDAKLYKNTVKSLMKKYPKADKKCSDAARMFYASSSVLFRNEKGKLITPVHKDIELINNKEASIQNVSELDMKHIPPGFSKCIWAIANGFFGLKEINDAFMSLITTCKKIGYTKEQAYYMAKNALHKYEQRTNSKYERSNGDVYNKDNIWREIVNAVYSESWGGAKYVCTKEGSWLYDYCNKLGEHGCDKTESPFNLMTMKQLFETKEELDWIVDGLLTRGGFSLMAGPPKSGKSTLTRQLARAIVKGESFLGREVESGRVLYLALEEQVSMFKTQMEQIGISEKDDILIHIGDIASTDPYNEVKKLIVETEPDLVVVDTLLLLGKIENVNDYTIVNEALKSVRMIARETGTHIVGVHHTNKGDGYGARKIMGSVAIHGAVDNAIMLEHRENTGRRFISTSQRGGRPFHQNELRFDMDTLHYELVPKGIGDDRF